MAIDRRRSMRGALAGAAAAGVWLVQQPLDKRVFGVDYDDAHLLGGLVTSGRAVLPVGTAMHLANGALFGAAYASMAGSIPGPVAARGPLAGLAEHLATWPLTVVLDRVHPATGRLPVLWGSGRAFAQATWRHLLFGAVLGALERRLNGPPAAAVDPEAVASNGHGAAESVVVGGPAPY
jgi:hypothetical protein